MNDFRYALRSLSRSKGFVAVAVLSLALALGLNTTVYAVLDAFLNPYLPYRAPERLVRYAITSGFWADREFSRNDRYLFLRSRIRFANTTAIYTLDHQLVTAGGTGERLGIADVSRNFFVVLGVAPARGRVFQPTGDENTVVVSDAFWRRLLGQQPLDKNPSLAIAGQPYTVIGVMPREMNLPEAADAWRPLPPDAVVRGIPGRAPQAISRLKDGVTPAEARAEVNVLVKEVQQGRSTDPGVAFDGYVGTLEKDPYKLSPSHWALAASAFVVLLIACANLANLMLARGIARRGELALRMAIGASRQALIRQLTVEGLILAVAGGFLGVACAVSGVSLAMGTLPTVQTFITLRPMHLGWHVVAFAAVTTGLITILIGLLPAIRASDFSVAGPLKDNAATTTGRGPGRYSPLAIAQVALALTLLMSSAILLRSTSQVVTEESDMNQPGVSNIWIPYPCPTSQCTASGDNRTDSTRLDHILQRVQGVPGVEVAASFKGVSLRTRTQIGGQAIADWEGATESPVSLLFYLEVSTDYFRTVGRRIVAGRHFDETDGDAMIVNATAAKGLWPQRDPIGRSFRIDNGPWIRVVGVVADFRYGNGTYGAVEPEFFYHRASSNARGGTIVFRPDDARPGVRAAVAQEVQAAAVLRTLPSVEDGDAVARLNATIKGFIARMFVFLAICGLGLASLGLYGVLAYTVSRRTREFGVRIALGATSQDVFRLVMYDGTVMFLAGTAIGAFIAMFMAQFVNALLYKVAFTDVTSLVVSEGILCGVAFLACVVPARRAMKSDPMEILRAT